MNFDFALLLVIVGGIAGFLAGMFGIGGGAVLVPVLYECFRLAGVPKDMDAAYEWFAAARDNGHAYAEFFMKRMERGEQEPPSVLLSATRLLYHMGNIFRDNAPAPAATGVQIDRKHLARLRQKRIALGHKPDDHEPEQQQGFSMKFHM